MSYHQIPLSYPIPYARLYVWVLEYPRRFTVPHPYRHRQGAVVWVTLPDVRDVPDAHS